MSLNYRLVRRPDMRKDAAEGSKLYYAQVRSLKKLKFEKFCNMVAVRSSAFVGGCETGHRRHPVRHGGTVGRRGCDPAGPPG